MVTIARNRWRSDRYVMLYLGVRHLGLGPVLMHPFTTRIVRRGAEFIGALSHVGNPTSDHDSKYVRARREYILLRRDL